MSQQLPPLPSSAPAHLRYFAAISLIAFVACQVIALLATDIVSTLATTPDDAREFSRVEMITRAHDTAYVQLPAVPAVLPLHLEEPKLLAANLAIDIDLAESTETRSSSPSNQVTQHTPSIRAPARHATAHAAAKPNLPRKSRATSQNVQLTPVKPAQSKIAALIPPELTKLRSPAPERSLTAVASLKSAVQAEAPARSEPVRKRLARNHPTSGELVVMQLLNQI